MTAEGWIGLAALLVAIGAIVLERLDSRRAGRVTDDQAAAISRLVGIEERRAAKEADAERRAIETAEADARAQLVGDLTVRVPDWAVNERPHLYLTNKGPHDVVIVSAAIRNGEPGGPGVRDTWVKTSGKTLTAGQDRQVPLAAVGPGPAWVDLRWRDGREGEQSQTIEIEIPPHSPMSPYGPDGPRRWPDR